MGKKILGTLINNFGFKLLALIFAFFLWLVVCNIDDPVKSKTFTCNVAIENENTLEDMSKYYEITNGTVVTFSASAQRSVIEKLSDYDFVAVADMKHVRFSDDMNSATIPINITCSRYTSSVKISDKDKFLTLATDDIKTERFMITANTKGKLAEGYALGDVSVSAPNVLRVTGPASVVNRIAGVRATINVDDMSVDLRDNVIPELFDTAGKKIDTSKLKLSSDTISISAQILNTKEVPVNIQISGKPEAPYEVVSVTTDVEKVQIKGTSALINPIMAINVPEEVFNVTGATGNITSKIDIAEYLPNGVKLVDNKDTFANVTIKIEPYQTREFMVKTENITLHGVPENMKASISRQTIGVMIGGLESKLNLLKADDITGSIVLDGAHEGVNAVELILNLDSGIYAPKKIQVDVVLTREQQLPETPPEITPAGPGTATGTGTGTGAGTGTGNATGTGTGAGTAAGTTPGAGTGNTETTEAGSEHPENTNNN